MKHLVPLSFVAAIFAFVILPVSFEIAVSSLVAAGFTSIALADYSRRLRPLPVPATVALTPFRREKLGLAA
jgi:hypothetical protein